MNDSEQKNEDQALEDAVGDTAAVDNQPGEETAVAADEASAEQEELAVMEDPQEPEEEPEPLQVQLQRLGADFDNFRKRTRREKETWSQQAQERIVSDLLTVVDHYELGLNNAEQHDAKSEVLDGFRMVHNQFLTVLKRYQVEPIEAVGLPFNPELHEAVSFLNSEDQAENLIIAETRRGYTMGDKLLRAAQVVVSSGPATQGETPEEDS